MGEQVANREGVIGPQALGFLDPLGDFVDG